MNRRMQAVAALCVAALAAGACSRAPKPAELSTGDIDTSTTSVVDDAMTTVPGQDLADPSAPTTNPDGTPAPTSNPVGTPAPAGQPGGQPAPSGTPPAGGGTAPPPPQSGPVLWSGADDTRGISKDKIVFCAHAALTYGAAFNTSAEDLNVYWTAVNAAGGVHGRKVEVYYENDNYSPDTAIEAAKACKDKYDPFVLLGGIGFDQIPAVRNWAENNKMPYLHHTATVNGSEGKQYSFTPLATTEKMGELFAELSASRFSGKKVGIIKRGSPNWEPGIDGFKKVAKERKVPVAFEREVPPNKGSYLQDIVDMRNSGTQVVFLWLNALESTEFITQTWAQGWFPQFMVFPFNITTQTLGDQALNPPIVGVNMHNAYSAGDYSGPFAAYADDMKQFEAQYDKFRPDADYEGVGSDLMFLNWASQKVTHQFLLQCGPDCTRTKFVNLLKQSKGTATSSVCAVDFTRPDSAGGHRGGFAASVLEAYKAPDGKVNFRNSKTCVEHVG